MYNEHFGFGELPFSVTADPQYFYSNAVYQEILSGLANGIADKDAFIVVTGDAGTGKTTLLRRVIFNFPDSIDYALISVTAPLGVTALLRDILKHLGLSSTATDRDSLLAQLNGCVLDRFSQGRTVVLLFDEAQGLSDEALREIPLLCNLQNDGESATPLVLMGQPELDWRLNELQLKRQPTLRRRLVALDDRDVAGYLAARLAAGGYRGGALFEPAAIERVIGWCKGNPRIINALCDNALLRTYRSSEHTVSAGTIDDAADDLLLDDCSVRVEPAPPGETGEPRERKEILLTESMVVATHDEPVYPSEDSTAPPSPIEGRNYQPEKTNRTWIISVGAAAVVVMALSAVLWISLQREPSVSSAKAGGENQGSRARLMVAAPAKPTENGGAQSAVKSPRQSVKPAWPPLVTSVQNDRNSSLVDAAWKKETSETRVAMVMKPWSEEVYRVSGDLFVRNEPTANAEIIATLQPGVRIAVTGRAGDYFRVSSMTEAPISGFVHKQDAFFDPVK